MRMERHKKIHAFLSFLLIIVSFFYLSGCKTTEMPSVATESDPEVQTGSICCSPHAQELTVTDADPEALEQILPLLPQLETLTLEGSIPPVQTLLSFVQQYPQLKLICPLIIDGQRVLTDTNILDLSNTAVSMEMLTQILPLFFNLQELSLMETNLTDQEKMMLADQLPGVLVRCELSLAGASYATDSTQIDISTRPVTIAEVEQLLPYFPCLKKLDMSFCGISDEDMDALNRKYPEISIVWTLTIGEVKLATDAVFFYPAGSNYYPTNEEMKKLRYCTELVAIDIGHTRASDCEFLWYTPHVKYLILADTAITDITPVGNLKELIYLELFSLNIHDYSPLLNCIKLQDLNIGTTHADPEPLTKMIWLHNLQWHRADQNPETLEAVLQLPEQLPDTNVVLYPKNKARNIGGPWRYLPNYYVFRDIIGADYFNQDQIFDYWGEADGARILACRGGKASSAGVLAEIVRERIERQEPIIGIKNSSLDKAEILYQSLLTADSSITER